MKNIEQYKERFYNLMESTIGNVKPILSEDVIDEEKIKEYKGKWAISNVLKDENSKSMYKNAIDTKTLISGTENDEVVNYYNKMVGEGKQQSLVSMYDKFFTSSNQSEIGNSPITKVEELVGNDLTKFYNVMIGNYQDDKTFNGLTLHSTLLKNRERNIPVKRLEEYINQATGETFNLLDIYNKISNKEELETIGKNTNPK